jgi:hypothetical protein
VSILNTQQPDSIAPSPAFAGEGRGGGSPTLRRPLRHPHPNPPRHAGEGTDSVWGTFGP